MKIDPPSIGTQGSIGKANITVSQGTSQVAQSASQTTRLPQLDQLVRQIAPDNQKVIVATVQANSLPLSNVDKALGSSQTQLYQVLLKVGNKEFTAVSPIPLLKGQQVELEINPLRGLAIKQISIDRTTLINDALKLLTPKHENLSALFTQLPQQTSRLESPSNKQEATIQQQLEKAITRLLNQAPRTQTLRNPQKMQQTLKQSGNFFEHQLKHVNEKQNSSARQIKHPEGLNRSSLNQTIQQDLKGQLKRFETNLRQLKQGMEKISQASEKTSNADKNSQAVIKAKTESSTSIQIKGETKTSTGTGENTNSKSTATQNATKETAKPINPPLPQGAGKAAQLNKLPPALRNAPYFQNSPAVLNPNQSETKPGLRKNSQTKENTAKVIERLIRQTSNALAKIQLNQISSLNQSNPNSTETSTTQQWLFEIPVNTGSHVETVNILIKEEEEKKADKNNEKEKRWHVNLSFDLEELGRLQVEFTLIGESARSTIWVENSDTYQRVGPQLSNLQTRLEALGLTVEKLDCRKGLPPLQKTGISSQLIDINT
ncbi:MAG: flagellar hook-length control protein FliK [Pseudomonadales bacterium]|nr:flagellar hook-length control protein FliK [Pseudomonadales bacterium]